MSGQISALSGAGVVALQAAIRAVPRRASAALVPTRPAAPGSVRRGTAASAALGLLALGLFTVSWERLLNVHIASYNVKLPSLLFSTAFVLALVAKRRGRPRPPAALYQRLLLGLTVAIVLYEVVRGVLSPTPAAAVAQLAAVLTGAMLPAAALLLLVRDRDDLRWALRWLLAGAALASAFGLYQLLAFYLGWPQGIAYTGVGIGTSIGRISAFSYEPAYFAYYLVLALGAYVTLRRMQSEDGRWGGLAAFAAMLYLANVRAVPLVVLAMGVVLLVAFRANRRLLARGSVLLAAAVAVAVAVPLALSAVTTVLQPRDDAVDERPPSVSAGPDGERPSDEPTPDPPEQALRPQIQSVDPQEPTSNGPRLALYTAVLHEVQQSPVFGLGPGNLTAALRRNAPETVADQGGGQVVANNVWLQALADGGVPLLLLELALVGTVLVTTIRRRAATVFPLCAAWLAVLGVGGMLTSYFFDVKVWVVLALIVVGLAGAQGVDRSRAAS